MTEPPGAESGPERRTEDAAPSDSEQSKPDGTDTAVTDVTTRAGDPMNGQPDEEADDEYEPL